MLGGTLVKKRPLSVTIISGVYIAAGAAGLAYHLTDLKTQSLLSLDIGVVSLVRLVAIIAGVFMLLGCDWARWLALAWMAFHAVLGALHSLPEFAMHLALLALFLYFLLRPPAARFFRPAAHG
jgi:hypothetical protein